MSTWARAVELAGRHVRLEPLRDDHAPGVLAAADDDAVFEHLRHTRPADLPAARSIVEFYRSVPTAAWAQIDATTGRLAGLTTFYDVDEELRTVAIGHTWLARRHWRGPVNTEAKLLLLTHAFDTLDCVRVVWHVDIRNERSQAAVLRLGAHREGVLRKHKVRRDGSWRDTVQFSMTDDDWPVVRPALQDMLTRPGEHPETPA